MVAARRTAAHVTSFFEIDLTRVGRLRQKMRAQFEAKKLTITRAETTLIPKTKVPLDEKDGMQTLRLGSVRP